MTQQEFRDLFTSGHIGDVLDYKQRLNKLADFAYRGIAPEAVAAAKTLTADDTNKVFLVSADAVITLPATEAGLKFTFICSGADGAAQITLSPVADDGIFGTIPNSAADAVSSGAVGKDLVNTKTTANKGDRVTIVADGKDGYYITEGVGIWASQG